MTFQSDTYNRVSLVGYLEAEPTYKEFGGNSHHAILKIFTRGKVRDAETSALREVKDRHRVVIHNKGLIDSVVRQSLGTGSHVLIEGRLKTRSWKDKDSGKWNYITEVIVQGMDCKIQLISNNKDR